MDSIHDGSAHPEQWSAELYTEVSSRNLNYAPPQQLDDDDLSAFSSLNEMPAQILHQLCTECGAKEDWEDLRNFLKATEDGRAAQTLGDRQGTPLHHVCQHNPPIDIVQMIIELADNTVSCLDQFGWLPLHYACFHGASDEVLEALVAVFPASVTTRDEKGRIPMHFLQMPGRGRTHSMETWRILSSLGATGCSDAEGMLPMHYGCAMGIETDVFILLSEVNPESVVARDVHGRTPLHLVCANLSRPTTTIVKLLIEANPNVVNLTNKNNQLPLHLLSTQASLIPEMGVDDRRETAITYLDQYLSAKPMATAEFITALQSLPDWLTERAVVNPIVQNILNDKMSQRFPTFFKMNDFLWQLVVIVSFHKAAYNFILIKSRTDKGVVIASLDNWDLTFISIGVAYFFFRESTQAISLWSLGLFGTYFTDLQNWVDMSSIWLVLLLTTFMYQYEDNVSDKGKWYDTTERFDTDWFRLAVVATTFFLYIQMLSFLDSLLIDFAVFKSGVIYVVKQLARGFLIVLLIFIVLVQQLFVTSFQGHRSCKNITTIDFFTDGTNETVLSEDAEDRIESLAPFCKPSWQKSFLKVFTMMLGEVDETIFRDNLGAQIVFALFMFGIVILLSNLLIAIVTDSYGLIRNEESAVVFWSSRLDFVAEMDVLQSFQWMGKLKSCLQIIKRPTYNAPATISYRGTVPMTKQEELLAEWWDELKQHAFEDRDDTLLSFSFLVVTFVRVFIIIVVFPIWLTIGLCTMGFFWPPQVREYLLVQRTSEEDRIRDRSPAAIDVYKEIKEFEDELKEDIETDEKISNEVNEELMSEINRIRESVTGLLDLSAMQREMRG